MQPNRHFTFNLTLIGLILSGCAARFDAGLSSVAPTENELPTIEQSQLGEKISAPNEVFVVEEGLRNQVSWGPVDEETFLLDRKFDGSLPQPVTIRDEQELGELVGKSVRNTFDNIDVVRRLTNNIFQLKLGGATQELIRFSINSTIGVGGLFDVAENGFSIKQSDPGDWVILKWMENPDNNGPSTLAKPENRTEFRRVGSFDHLEHDDHSWRSAKEMLKEGDLIAYGEDKWEARTNIFLKGRLNHLAYRLFKYGHIAIVVKDPGSEDSLRLLTSYPFQGPTTRESLDTLKSESWDVYRLNHWDRVDKKRFYDFIELVQEKAGRWYGYDFSGMFGLWNSNLQPSSPEEIGNNYICSTVIVAALHYAGVELDVSQRHGVIDVITPLQLVRSKGRVISLPHTTHESPGKEPQDDGRWAYRPD